MSSVSDIHPSTIEGIKRLAKPIKREKRVAHSEALDLAAQSAGFQNFRHARNQLEATQPLARPRHTVLITGYWRDQTGQAGRETLRIFLSERWPAVLRPAELQCCRGLGSFRIDASDHLESRKDFPDQASTIKKVCEAGRALQFMDITALRPLTRRPPRRTGSRNAPTLPMRDHPSFWRDPVTAEIIEVDEPYRSPNEALSARQEWAEAVGASVATTSWAGMYVPGMSHLYMTSHRGRADLLADLVAKLNDAPAPVTESKWTGESARYLPLFVSPCRSASGKAKAGRRKPIYKGLVRRNAVVYGHVLFGGSWRPNARMPLNAHRETANLLKELVNTAPLRTRPSARLEHVRCELDEWVQREYPTGEDLPQAEFFDLYYHAFTPTQLTHTEAVDRVESLLLEHYPDCVPRRDLVRCLAAVRRELQR